MSFALVGSFNGLVSTSYGQALIGKIALVALLLTLAAANKFRFIPELHKKSPTAAKNLTHSISAEWLAIFAILGITAVLTSNLNLPM